MNNCLDLAQDENGVLKPAAMLVAALQWVNDYNQLHGYNGEREYA